MAVPYTPSLNAEREACDTQRAYRLYGTHPQRNSHADFDPAVPRVYEFRKEFFTLDVQQIAAQF